MLEGVAFGLRDGLDLVAELGGAISSGRVSGGGARSDLWLSIIASALEIPLDRVRVDAGAAFGAALLGGVAGGIWPHRNRRRGDRRDDRADRAGPEWVERYRDLRPRYQALYPALRHLPAS